MYLPTTRKNADFPTFNPDEANLLDLGIFTVNVFRFSKITERRYHRLMSKTRLDSDFWDWADAIGETIMDAG
jgi:hypothetical protein